MKESTKLKIIVAILPFGIPILLTYEAYRLYKKRKKEKEAKSEQSTQDN